MGKSKHVGGLQQFLEQHRVMAYRNQDGAVDTLDLTVKETTDDLLELLWELPSLRTIGLQGTQITDKGLAHLSQLGQLEDLDLRSCKGISDMGMEHLSKLGKLKRLELYGTQIGDNGLGLLIGLANLESLNLHSTRVTDSGLTQLQKFPKLQILQIGGKGPTDAGLQRIGLLQQLKWLEVAESSFTDLGLAELGRLTRLTHLFIARTQITGVGFKQLAKLTKLESLHASKTPFSDEGLKYLVSLKRLKRLALDGTAVTDKGLKHLTKLEKLKDLGLENTRVTKQGKENLKLALPRCVIHVSADAGQVSLERYDEDYFWSHPPRCLAGFTAKAMRHDRPTTYQLLCSCKCETGTVVGFPLSNYSQAYKGHEFVGPLGFLCAQCNKTTEIIDTEVHGYDGECGSSVTIRGKGKRVDYRCPKCGSNKMRVIVHFEYDGGELDLKKDEPSITVEDFFAGFSAGGICAECQERVSIAEFECA